MSSGKWPQKNRCDFHFRSAEIHILDQQSAYSQIVWCFVKIDLVVLESKKYILNLGYCRIYPIEYSIQQPPPFSGLQQATLFAQDRIFCVLACPSVHPMVTGIFNLLETQLLCLQSFTRSGKIYFLQSNSLIYIRWQKRNRGIETAG